MADSPAAPDRLDSWKAIAAYLDRGVRTVRRWEHDEGLPVHRHLHKVQGSVYAYRSEIDAWRKSDARRAHARAQAAFDRRPSSGEQKSIAVLPFANLSTDPENAYFADGLTDEVIADLSRVRGLRVTSRTSSMAFKGAAMDVKAIARELGVRYVIEGGVRRAGSRLRITAQLIDANADDHLWSGKYEGTTADVFAFQEKLARVIVEALEVRLGPDEAKRLGEHPISNVRAYECYLRARQEAWRWRKDAIDHAIQLLHHGLEIAGENAALYAALGFAHLQYREAGIDVSARPLEGAEACARKVFELDPASGAGLQLRGWLHYSRGGMQAAVRDLTAALAIDANSAETLGLLCNCYLISGKVEAARPLIARLLAVDPLTPLNQCMPGFADIMDGDFAPAVAAYRRMFEMDPSNPMARLFYVWVLVLNGRVAEAGPLVASFPVDVQESVPARLTMFLMHAASGSVSAAEAVVGPALEAMAGGGELFPRMLAEGYALAGQADRSLDWLEIAVSRGFINYPFLTRHDPFLKDVRTHPRFVALAEGVRERWERFES